MNRQPSPPGLFLKLFRWYCHPKLLGYIEGDLMEVYNRRLRTSGKKLADVRFITDVILLARPGIIKPAKGYSSINSYDMYKNYFKTAFRNLWKNKGYSAINILGLAIGMAVALLIGLWVKFQFSYDIFHENRDNIAIVMKRTYFNDVKGTQYGVMLPLYDELKTNYPEVKRATRLDWGGTQTLAIGDKMISKRGHYADPDLLTMFTFPLVKGDVSKALSDPHSVVITESLAVALFNDEEPMGRTVLLNNRHELIVTGVMKDVPFNSSITFDFVVPFELRILIEDWVRNSKDNWGNNFLQTIVELNDGVTPEAFSARIENLLREKMTDGEESTFFVHPMSRWRLYSKFENWVNTGGMIEIVRLFSVIGLLVLGIACINFINLTTARSEKRAREVGIRKAVGSHRQQLVMQFLAESMVTAALSFILALLMVRLSLPALSNIGFENVTLDLTDFRTVGIIIGACLLTGLLAGWYPALYLSGIKAVSVLKGSFKLGRAADLPRKVLIVTQFSFSVALIIATVVVFLQIEHARNRPLGYEPNNLVSIYITRGLGQQFEPMKNELLATGQVEAVSYASSPMTGVYNTWDGFSWQGMDPNSHPIFSAIQVGYDYDKASGITMKEGRFFSREFGSDTSAVIINEATAKLIGFKEPVGNVIITENSDRPLTIIGVTRDVVMQDPYKEVPPALLFLVPDVMDQGLIRLAEGTSPEKGIAAIRPIIERFNPGFPFDYRFTSDSFERKFLTENRIGKLAGIFTGLSVLLSCMGLFGLASFMAERRTKEIGIRKVVGASVFNLWRMLSKDFVMLVIVACVIAVPSAYFLMTKWLSTYQYRTEIPIWIPILTGAGTLAITLLTVSYQTIRAAKMNPVRSLRTE